MTPRGNAAAHGAFRSAIDSGSLHHAWLFAGPRGVGKARFADAAALRLLAEAATPGVLPPGFDVPGAHPSGALFRAGSHPDFKALARLPKDKDGVDLSRSITVDQVRGLQRLFATSPSMSFRRVVVIDAVDDLERAGANALLKSLEEPPAGTIFLLISHAPGRLLATIRSRCRLLRFARIADAEVAAVIEAELPEIKPAEMAALVREGRGAPGQALRFVGLDVAAIETAMVRIANTGDPSNQLRLTLAKSLGSKAAHARYEAFLEKVPTFIADRALAANGDRRREALFRYEAARSLIGSAIGLSLDAQATVFEMAGHLAALAGGD